DPLTGNPLEIANAPRHYIDDAIDWLQEFASNKMDADVDCASFVFKSYKQTTTAWKDGVPGDGDSHSGSQIHNALGGYNENGQIGGFEYAGDADSVVFTAALSNVSLFDTSAIAANDDSQMMYMQSLVSV
ncbi:MAG: hypothetical protein ACK4NZ_12410, partial [Tsuneonella sp.]